MPLTPLRHRSREWVQPIPVKTHQIKWEFERLLYLFNSVKPSRILEIGTAEGGTLYEWLKNAPPRSTVVAVDNFRTSTTYPEKSKDLMLKWAGEFHQTLELVEGDTLYPEVWEKVPYYEYEWIFIDGGHQYNEVSSDFWNSVDLAARGAIIALHDIYTDMGVTQLWKEIRGLGFLTQEIVSLATLEPEWDGMGIGVVYLDK